MYRDRNGSKSFSFNRLMLNAFPNFASDNPQYAEFTPDRQDMFYHYQLSTQQPLILAPNAFFVAGSVDSERRSEQVHRALEKNGVLTADGKVDTTKIGPKFIHQLAFVDQMSQKNLVNVLFFWEEEVHRLVKLDAEEKDLTALIESTESAAAHPSSAPADAEHTQTLDQLRFARERVRMKMRQKPTERRDDLEADRDTTVQDAFVPKTDAPPYEAPPQQQQASSAAPGQELPPRYLPPRGPPPPSK